MGRAVAMGLLLLALGPASAAADGPDRSFGHGGSASFAPQRFSAGDGVAVDAQGRTLVAATLDDGSLLRTRAAVLRLLPDGSLDPAFGTGGVATIAPPAPYLTSSARAIALDSQGRVVIAGEVDDDVPAAARLLPDGIPDPGFASNGILVAKGAYGGLPGGWNSVVLDGSSIVLAGAVDGAPPFGTGLGRIAVLARLDDAGVPETSFGTGGYLALTLPGVTFASTHALAIDHRGRIVLGIWRATTVAFPGDVAAEVVRLTPAGYLDSEFGNAGLAMLGPLQGRGPAISVTGANAIVAIGGWTARSGGGVAYAARLRPSGALDPAFGANGELVATAAPPTAGALDCQGNLLISSAAGVQRFGPDGRLDRGFHGAGIPAVAVGMTTAAASFDSLAFAPGGSVVLGGSAVDGPITIGGSSQIGNTSIAVARVQASCPIVDSTPPTVKLTCSAGCRRVVVTALDDPVGRMGRARVGIERLTRGRCESWNGRRFARLPCSKAEARLIAVPLVGGAYRTPPLGSGRFVVRAVAVDRSRNRSRVATLRVSR